MADVISISRSDSHESGKYSSQNTGSDVAATEATSSDEDVIDTEDDDATVEELESLLKQYKGYDKRVKIRETIRLLKESLREDSTPSGSRSESADSPIKTPTTSSVHKSVFSTTTSGQSSPKVIPETPVEFSISFQKPSGSTTLSRFTGRSTSLRTARPSYQPPAEAVQRTSSFKLSRPKDFIIKKVDSSPQLSKVPESTPSEFREYADNLNNNIPAYKLPSNAQKAGEVNLTSSPVTVSSGVSHNKTASPFSASPKSTFRKQVWSPPAKPVTITVNTSLPIQPTRSLQVTGLRRSESTKENRSTDFQPIPIVRGNVRRSKSILGRILGQKIGESPPLVRTSVSLIPPKVETPSQVYTKHENPSFASAEDFEAKETLQRTEDKSSANSNNESEDSSQIINLSEQYSPLSTPEIISKVDSEAESQLIDCDKETNSKYPTGEENKFEQSSSERESESNLSPNQVCSLTSSRSSSSSSSSGSEDDEHVYEVENDSDSLISSCDSDKEGSHTLSELILATQQHPENDETSSVPQTIESEKSDLPEAEACHENESIPSEENTNLIHSSETGDTSISGEKNFSTGQNPTVHRSRQGIVVQSLTAHTVFQVETARVFNVEVVKPVLACKEGKDTQPSDNTQTQKQDNNKEILLSSSSSSSAELSDDEDSSPEENNMDRFSSRALQSRVSVKQQILANEDGTFKSGTPSRRSRHDRNKPINTGDDVKSRIQKFKVQVNGDADKPSPVAVKRNGSVKIPGASGKKLDVSKFEKGTDENANVTPNKTTITLSTGTPRSTLRSNSKEENIKKSNLDTEKPTRNGSSDSSSDVTKKIRNSSSSSATDDSARPRRTRRTKPTEAESTLEKIERVASQTTTELKDTHAKKYTTDATISTRKSRERVTPPKEDFNNNTNTSNGDVAPTNGNKDVELVVNDSLSSWSERRRKKREKRLQLESATSTTTSGTENEKSTDDASDNKEAEEEKEAAKTISTITHVQHSAPVLTDMGGYSFNLSRNGVDRTPSREEPDIPEKEEQEDDHQEVEVSKIERTSRSSVTRSSTSSGAENADARNSDDNEGLTLTADNRVADETEEKNCDVDEKDNVDDEPKAMNGKSDYDVVQNERIFERDETREPENDNKETDEIEVREENKESEAAIEQNENDDQSSINEETKSPVEIVIEDDKKSTENNDILEEYTVQTNDDNKNDAEVYNTEPVVENEQIEKTPDLETTRVENEVTTEKEKVETQIEQKTDRTIKESTQPDGCNKERTRRPHKDRKSSSEVESEKPKRRHHRKKVTGSEAVDDDKEKSERRHHRRHKKSTEEKVESEIVVKEKVEEKVPEKKERKRRKSREEKESKKETEIKKDESEPKKDTNIAPDTKESEKSTPSTTEETKQEKSDEAPKEMHFSYENVEEITDIALLEKMLEVAEEYEHRRRIRSVLRALRRGEKPNVVKDTKWKSRTTNGSSTKKEISPSPGDLAKRGALPKEGARESRLTSSKMAFTKIEKTDSGSKYTSIRTERTTMSGQKKIGSIFDRGDDDDDTKKSSRSSGSTRLADLERRQAERKRELQRNRSMPASTSKDARKAFVAKLEAGAPKTQGKKVGRSPTFVVPNANNVKQLLLKWCQSKTRGYEHVDIMNFSSSWASGMAFCALVHNFFPQAFDYTKLDPKNRAENFDLAFKSAEEFGGVAPLLEVEDMIIMGNRPDSKCVFTYVQFLYNHFRKYDQPLVPLKDGQGKSQEGSGQKLVIKKMGETEDL